MLILDPKEIKVELLPSGYTFVELGKLSSGELINFELVEGKHIVFYKCLGSGNITKSPVRYAGELGTNYSKFGYSYAIAQKGKPRPRFECEKPFPWGY